MAIRIKWHEKAFAELSALDFANRERIRKLLAQLSTLDDPRQRLVPYSANLKGFWKLRSGDYRLVCEIRQNKGQMVLIIHLAHRSRIYSKSGLRTILSRSADAD